MDIFSIANKLDSEVWEKKDNVPDDLNKLGNSVTYLSLFFALKAIGNKYPTPSIIRECHIMSRDFVFVLLVKE